MYAIIKANGKQYKVEPGQKIELDRINAEPGEVVSFDEVILYSNDGESVLGTPLLDGYSVKAEVLEHFRAPKIIVFKMKRRKRNRVKRGHRQEKTRLQINEIVPA
ncbi:MAG: 50S ribosomal protein L21 [Oligosphaeraceae bacterium]|jgi:large subunit ribosomal protein L21|nr:50S ribosomal protein L21 [Oligosphaeraceae bacterium]